MAGLKTTVEILLKGKDLASGAFNSANKSANDLAGGVRNATQPIADFTTSLWKVQGAATAAGIAMVGFATKTAIDAESAVIELQKVMSKAETDEFDKYSKKLGEIADTYASTKTEATLMAAEFRQSGFSAEESMGLVSDALKLAAVSELSAADATKVFIKQLKGSKQPAQETARLIDILNYSSNNSGSSVGLLGDAMARTAATFKATGYTWEEQAALLEPLTTTYQRSELAASAFNTGLQRLGSTNKNVLGALDSMGIALKNNITGEATTAKERFTELLAKFPELSESKKLIVAQEIFGLEQAAKMIGILGEQESIQRNITNLKEKAAGSADKEFEIFAKAAQFQLDQVVASFKNLSGAIGGQFLDSVKNSFGGMANLLQSIKKEVNNGTFDDIFNGISANFDGFAESLNTAAKNLPNAFAKVDFKGLVESFNNVFDSLYDLFGFDLGTEKGLTDAIQFVIDSVKTLNNVVAGSFDALKPFVDEFKEWVNGFNQTGKESQEAVGEMLGMLTAINKIAGVAETFTGILGSLAGAIEALAFGKLISSLTGGKGLVAGLKSASTGTKNLITKLGQAGTAGSNFFENLGKGSKSGKIAKSFGLLSGKLALYAGAAYGGYEAGKKLGSWLDENAPTVSKNLKSIGEGIGGWLGEKYGDLTNDGDNAEEAFAAVANQVKMLEEKLGRSITNWKEYKKAVADLKLRNASGEIRGLRDALKEQNQEWDNYTAALKRFKIEEAMEKVRLVEKGVGRSVESYKDYRKALDELHDKRTLEMFNRMANVVGRSISSVEEYREAFKELKEEGKDVHKLLGKASISVEELEIETKKSTDTNIENVKSNQNLQGAIQKSGQDVDKLKEKLTNFNKQAKIEATKASEVFDFANQTIEFQIDSSLKAFQILTDKTRNITDDQKKNISNFINQNNEQTKSINNAQINMLEAITDQKRAQTDLIRNMTEFGTVRVEASDVEPELTAIFNSIFRKSKIQMLGAAQLPTTYGDES